MSSVIVMVAGNCVDLVVLSLQTHGLGSPSDYKILARNITLRCHPTEVHAYVASADFECSKSTWCCARSKILWTRWISLYQYRGNYSREWNEASKKRIWNISLPLIIVCLENLKMPCLPETCANFPISSLNVLDLSNSSEIEEKHS